jgi:hypothetical protein
MISSAKTLPNFTPRSLAAEAYLAAGGAFFEGPGEALKRAADALARAAAASAADGAGGGGANCELLDRAAVAQATFPIAGQFRAPAAWRAELRGVIDFGFPVIWNIERGGRAG